MKKSLNLKQAAFAAQHHDLIYEFLHERHLSEDEYYDVAALAYIECVTENDESDFRNRVFEAMKAAVTREMKTENGEAVSLCDMADAYRTFEEVLADEEDPIDALLERIEQEHQIARFDPREQQLITLLLQGFGLNEIRFRMQKTAAEFDRLVSGIRSKTAVADTVLAA